MDVSIVKEFYDQHRNRLLVFGSSGIAVWWCCRYYKNYIDSKRRQKAVKNFPDLRDNRTLMARYLTPEMYSRLFYKTTGAGFTLDSAIQTGVDDKESSVGVVAGDEESYSVFSELFDLIIEDRHNGFRKGDHQVSDFDYKKVLDGRLDEKYVTGCKVMACRSIRGFRLPSTCSREERRKLEMMIKTCLNELTGDVQGRYYPISAMTPDVMNYLIDNKYAFKAPETVAQYSAGVGRDWPDARGVWFNETKTFIVWVNEQDHVRVMSMQAGGDIPVTFERFCRGMKEFERQLKNFGREFMRSRHHGYINMCPSNIGTGLIVSVNICLPSLSKVRFSSSISYSILNSR